MDKPEDYKSAPRQIREEATLLITSFGHDLPLLEGAISAAILSAQSQAYIDAARIASEAHDWDKGEYEKDPNDGPFTLRGSMATSKAISAAILQRKEEIGR